MTPEEKMARVHKMVEDVLSGKDMFAMMDATRMRTEVGDDTIDTTDTVDAGWETAVINDKLAEKEGCSPITVVQNYDTEEEAKAGHEKWVKAARDGTLEEAIRLQDDEDYD
jgi:hypothetical protein